MSPESAARGSSRRSARRARGDRQPALWRALLESKVLVALVTVLLGGWVGSCITASIQEESRKREQALLAYEKHLGEGLQLIKEAYSELGRLVAAAENLIVMTGPAWDPDLFSGELKQSQLNDHILKLRREYNEADAQWRRQQRTLGWRLGYYYGDLPEVQTRWSELLEGAEAFQLCAVEWNRNHFAPAEIEGACRSEGDALDAAFSRLNQALSESQLAGWKIWLGKKARDQVPGK